MHDRLRVDFGTPKSLSLNVDLHFDSWGWNPLLNKNFQSDFRVGVGPESLPKGLSIYARFGRFLCLHGRMTLCCYVAQKANGFGGFPLQHSGHSGFNGSNQCSKSHVSMDHMLFQDPNDQAANLPALGPLFWRDAHRAKQKPRRPSGRVSPRSRQGTQPVALWCQDGLYCLIVRDISLCV